MKINRDDFLMSVYVIKNKKTGKLVTGTDYRYHPPHQITDGGEILVYMDKPQAENDFRLRQCGKNYKVVEMGLLLDSIVSF